MIVRRRDAVTAEPVGAASAGLNGLTAHGRPPYERTDGCVEDRRTANRGLHSPCGNNDRYKTGWRYVSCRRKTVDRGSPDPHGVFNFHARHPDGTRVRPMGLPISGEDTSGDRSAPSDAPPGRVVRSFCPLRGQEVQQSRSPLFVFHGGRYGESPSFRSWPRRAAPVPPSDDGRQPARSIGLAIGFRGTRDRGFGLQDTCPHAGTIPASRPGSLERCLRQEAQS